LATEEQNECEIYRVIILGRDGTKVLLVPTGDQLALPSVTILRWQRVAENLTAAVKSDWGEEVVSLFDAATGPRANSDVATYQAAEHLRTCGDPKLPTRWTPLSALGQDSLIDARDYAAIRHVVGICSGETEGIAVGPFARLGWFRELRNWIESVIEPAGFHVNGDFRQLNASPAFSLVRFATSGPTVWFKAVGEPNQREFAITCLLAQLFPEFLPRVLARRPDWNGWLTREVPGELLSNIRDRLVWERAATALARLQIQSIDHGAQILGACARDLGSATLSKLIQPFINVVAQLMERQTKVPPPVLNRKNLLVLADSLHSAVDAMGATGIPETLGHLDLNPGNIVVSNTRCAFLDWVEAYIGNPFFSLEYLLQHARREFGTSSAIESGITQAYCAQWGGVLSPGAIVEAWAFAPLLAVFAYAAGNDAWQQPERLQEPGTAGYLRSLARRMHREANELADRRLLCRQ
jgi:hypothetical protein